LRGCFEQHRPFTVNGPVQETPEELRAVTVFGLADLVGRAKDRTKEVIRIARRRGPCGSAHTRVLRALLSKTEFRVSSRLVLACTSAATLLKQREKAQV
jgi:hypothetical protein